MKSNFTNLFFSLELKIQDSQIYSSVTNSEFILPINRTGFNS